MLESKLTVARTDDLGARRARLERLRAEFERFLDQWRSTPLRSDGVGFLRYGMRRLLLSELMRLTMLVDPGAAGVEAALDALHRAQALGSAARRAGYRPGPVNELLDRLVEERRGLLIYMPGPDRGHVFAVDRAQRIHAEMPPFLALNELREAFVVLATAPPDRFGDTEKLHCAGDALGSVLLPDTIRARVQTWSAATIVGLELLDYVPFEFLPLEGGRDLGEDLAVAYLPSLPMGALLAEHPDPLDTPAAVDLFLLASPSVGAAAEELGPKITVIPFEATHRDQLTSAFAPERVRVFTGDEAHRGRLASADAIGARVLQILAHGVPEPELGREAALVLAPTEGDDTGLLEARDVRDAPTAPLVVLTACSAGRRPLRRGEDGLGGLGGAFLSAGARAVLLSPNELELQSQYELLRVFYRRLVRGDSPAESLRIARRHLAGDPRWAHPYYGSVYLAGLGHEPVFAAR